MKTILLTLLVLCVFVVSCDRDDEEPSVYLIGNWELVLLTGGFPGAVQEGDDLEWREKYTFNADRTFTKSRETDDGLIQSKGSYEVLENRGDNFLLHVNLVFETGGEIAGSCGPANSESLSLTRNKVLQSDWSACDGPGLFYEKGSF